MPVTYTSYKLYALVWHFNLAATCLTIRRLNNTQSMKTFQTFFFSVFSFLSVSGFSFEILHLCRSHTCTHKSTNTKIQIHLYIERDVYKEYTQRDQRRKKSALQDTENVSKILTQNRNLSVCFVPLQLVEIEMLRFKSRKSISRRRICCCFFLTFWNCWTIYCVTYLNHGRRQLSKCR